MKAHTSISVLVAAATAVAAGPAPAQSSGEITIVSEPACALEGVLQPVTVSVSPSGAATADNGGSAGRVTILCNTGGATIAVGSDAMTTDAVIDPSELNRFTREIDFAAYAQVPGGANAGYRLASRPGIFGAWQRAAINAGNPSRRRLELDISATGFSTSQRMPVAGRYRGRICVTISPTGLPAPANAQATAGCGGGS
ncbi:MAG: hypothetical protein MUF14_00345 [Hyphomonadaceae bacterium]|nr:hypothetical protein [Hyphomonadaceae bacterium]